MKHVLLQLLGFVKLKSMFAKSLQLLDEKWYHSANITPLTKSFCHLLQRQGEGVFMGTTSLKFKSILSEKRGKKKIKLHCWLALIGEKNNTKESSISQEDSAVLKASSRI